MQKKFIISVGLFFLLSPLSFAAKSKRSPSPCFETKIEEINQYYRDTKKARFQTQLQKAQTQADKNKVIDQWFRQMTNCKAAKKARDKRREKEQVSNETILNQSKTIERLLLERKKTKESLEQKETLIETIQKELEQLQKKHHQTKQELEITRQQLDQEIKINERLMGIPNIPEDWWIP